MRFPWVRRLVVVWFNAVVSDEFMSSVFDLGLLSTLGDLEGRGERIGAKTIGAENVGDRCFR